jgi:hypothetical protein
MKDKDLNRIAAIEKVIAEKYGSETIAHPQADWDDEKEKDYILQMKEFYAKERRGEGQHEKVDINGIKVSKKLLNRESLRSCSICGNFPKKSMDDVCLTKYEVCAKCHVQYVQGREERWLKGWRPNNGNSL